MAPAAIKPLLTRLSTEDSSQKAPVAVCHYPASCYLATGPAQPLVGITVGPSHKQPTVKEQALEKDSANSWGEWWLSSSERGKRRILDFPSGPSKAHGPSGQPRDQTEPSVLRGS